MLSDSEAVPTEKREKTLAAIRAVLATARSKRGGAAPGAVVQADVDLAADELVVAGVRPYVQLLARVTGGSLTTLTPMFEDWWQRFAARRSDPERAVLAAPLRATLHLRHLLAALENAVREELALEDPQVPLLNALRVAEITALKNEVRALKAQLQARSFGESSALTQQVANLEAHRDQLQRDLEITTYQVAQLTSLLDARHEALRAHEDARRDAFHRLQERFARLEALLTRPANSDGAFAKLSATLKRLHKQLGTAKPQGRLSPRARKMTRRPHRERAYRAAEKKSKGVARRYKRRK